MREKFQGAFNGFVVDSDQGLKLENGRQVALAPKELASLCLLLRRAGKVVAKTEFIEKVWRGVAISDSSLTRCISNLKRHLEQASCGAAKLIQAEYGRGYRFVGTLSNSQSFISDEAFYALINISPDFVAVKDGQGRWLAVNQAGIKLYELEGKEWQGKTDMQLAELVPHYREGFAACVASDEAAWQGRATSYSMENALSENVLRTFHVAKSPLFNADGSRKMLVVLGRDVTELLEVSAEGGGADSPLDA